MSEIVYIAWCPEHGLHGEREECFVCGREVDQVEMVPTTWRGLEAILDAYYPTGVFDGSSGDPGSRIVVLAAVGSRLRPVVCRPERDAALQFRCL